MRQPDHPPRQRDGHHHEPADNHTNDRTTPATDDISNGDELPRGPGRPRKWANNAERMRAYRRRQQAETAKLRNRDGRRELVEQLDAVTAERDQLAADVVVLRRRINDLETQLHVRHSAPPPVPPSTTPPTTKAPGDGDQPRLSRAQRRRLEREQRRHR